MSLKNKKCGSGSGFKRVSENEWVVPLTFQAEEVSARIICALQF